MILHELKIKSEYYADVITGVKTFELRENDRNFQVGDLVHFKVVDDKAKKYRDPDMRNALFVITYVLKDVPEYGLNKDYCIFGLRRIYL